jgi:hypothetical protein
MERADLLVGSILTAIRLRDMWITSGVPNISDPLAQAIDDVMIVWEDGDIPADCRPLYDAYLKLKQCWIRFGEYMSEREKSPRRDFWDALKELEGVLINREERFLPPMLESITDLRKLNPQCTWVQICYIYAHKGNGPFMDKFKRPQTTLAMQQHKWESLCGECRKLLDGNGDFLAGKSEKHFCGACKGAKNVVKEWFASHGLSPYDEDGNLISLASVEKLRSASRVSSRLRDRVSRLLTGSDYPRGGQEMEEVLAEGDELPLTREQQDALERGEMLSPQRAASPAAVQEALSESALPEPGSIDEQIQTSEESAIAEQIMDLIRKNPQIDNQSLAETFGMTPSQVKRIRQRMGKQ